MFVNTTKICLFFLYSSQSKPGAQIFDAKFFRQNNLVAESEQVYRRGICERFRLKPGKKSVSFENSSLDLITFFCADQQVATALYLPLMSLIKKENS